MYILAIDPGFSSVGWTLGEISEDGNIGYVGCGVIRTKKSTAKVLACEDNVVRAREIAGGIMSLFEELQAHPSKLKAIVSEAQSWPRNASVSAKVGMCWGVMSTFAHVCEIPLVQVSPQNLKKCLTGKKTASKKDVADVVCKVWPKIGPDAKKWPTGQHEHIYDSAAALIASSETPVVHAMLSMARSKTQCNLI